jgi:hypothetical protein
MKRAPGDYRERTYRSIFLNNNFIYNIQLTVGQTDLLIRSDVDQSDFAHRQVVRYRTAIESYITANPLFLTSLNPLGLDELAPPIVRAMLSAARMAGVGPMAAVAGAIAEFVGRDLLEWSRNVIVENGGDVFIAAADEVHVGIFAGDSPLNGHVSLSLSPGEMPVGVCTSSGTVGHSLSLGRADAVCIKAKSTALADAVATAVANQVRMKPDISRALDTAMGIPEVLGALIILDDHLGAIGAMELVDHS